MAKTFTSPFAPAIALSTIDRKAVVRSKQSRQAGKLDLALRIADYADESAAAPIIPATVSGPVVPTFNVLRHDRDFDLLVAAGFKPCNPIGHSAFFNVTAPFLRADDLVDGGFYKWAERREDFDAIDAAYAYAEQAVTQCQSEHWRITGESVEQAIANATQELVAANALRGIYEDVAA